ncbi:F0F1 ATP synthase subunit delta [Microbacterium sp. STN6]|uniref:F0F1 ATP synthase subunit delta n=1 Tax=Microbacterium sp. STN6 TaxID=2995588 RepID=UPI002260BB47|nr:F0F1 ATP synthase subunit delta [Microbacterium sp. STN6]MCX7521173.1 F0F1 ATP synthase subunit delta [Microbacterium sp. STN6]
MGSATRHALTAARATLGSLDGSVDLQTALDLFSIARVFGENAQLRAALADPAAASEDKSRLIGRVFDGRLAQNALALATSAVEQRWSNQDELLAGIEELGIRAASLSADSASSIEKELFAFGEAVASDAQLELALGSKLGLDDAKVALIGRLLQGKASEETVAIVRQLVLQPRGRSTRVALRQAASIVSDQRGEMVAVVTSAAPVAPEQLDRLAASLSAQYDTKLTLNLVIDPAVLGGLRVQVGDDIIDGTIATRLNDVRQKLAG